jgi:hypothetical protein
VRDDIKNTLSGYFLFEFTHTHTHTHTNYLIFINRKEKVTEFHTLDYTWLHFELPMDVVCKINRVFTNTHIHTSYLQGSKIFKKWGIMG